MSKLAITTKTMPETTVTVGSEGAIRVCENGGTIRVLTAEQARDLAHALEKAADHSKGRLIGDGV